MAHQTVELKTASPIDFVNQILHLGREGYVLKDNTFPRLKGFPITASFTLQTDKTVEVEPQFLSTIPVPLSEQVYSKEELDAMEWDAFRELVKSRGVKGRVRDKMTKQYLEAVESGKDAVDDESVEDSE